MRTLKAQKITKTFHKRMVLKGVDLTISTGEAVGLLGPNGAGKTTCFSVITGLILPDSGKIFVDDLDVTDAPMYKRARMGISYLPQDSSIFRGLNVEENILAALERVESDPDRQQERLEQLLDEFGITHLREAPSVTLSGGERRRVEIARSLAINPDFLFLDEPLAGIDPIAVQDVKDIIKRLKNRNIGILITDHNVRETLDVVDRAYIIAEGKVLTEGDSEHVINHPDVRRVYLGERFSL
ncbi:MAG: LPS export ABC transporter ATP-binding protein [Proteobacteria bacterium]|nr:LPS export ABC transporter ATP-binding protein [Pseudomonadota bacterium]